MIQSECTGEHGLSTNGWQTARELVHEHGVLLRQIGSLQRRCTELLRTSASRVAELEAENLRTCAELVRLRTSVFWGLGSAQVVHRPRRLAAPERPPVDARAQEAQAVICQTGCVGHAHPWLEADGQCRRSGQACDWVSEDSTTPER